MRIGELLPHSVRKYGYLLFIAAFTLEFVIDLTGLKTHYFVLYNYLYYIISGHFSNNIFGVNHFFKEVQIMNTVNGIMGAIGTIFIAFSKEKIEDEYLLKLRLESLIWACFINAALIIVVSLCVFDFEFLYFMIFEMYAIPILGFIRFKYLINKNNKITNDGE